jgi:hypothetical protein
MPNTLPLPGAKPRKPLKPIPSINFVEVATRAVEMGLRVFPVKRNDKIPLIEAWQINATTSEDQIAKWGAEWPNANVGILANGLLIVDVDTLPDGSLNQWLLDDQEKLDSLNACGAMSMTTSGGRHFYFLQRDGENLRNTTSKLAPNVDTRANGGYAVFPGSVMGGKYYEWIKGYEPDCHVSNFPIRPEWLVEKLGSNTTKSPAHYTDGATIAEGGRNSQLFSAACALRNRGFSYEEISAAIQTRNQERCTPPLTESEVDRIVANACKYEPDKVAQMMTDGPANGPVNGKATAKRKYELEDGIPDDCITNGVPGKGVDKKGNETDITVPITLANTIARIHRTFAGKLHRVGSEIFAHPGNSDEPVRQIETHNALFSCLSSGPCGVPRIFSGPGFSTKQEIHIELQETLPNFKAIETRPHEPLIPGHFYACETIPAGDGSMKRVNQLLDRYKPATAIDRHLMLVAAATALSGIPGGTRPLFIITAPAGRGAGKTSFVKGLGLMFGEVSSFSLSDSDEEVCKRMLSPLGRKSSLILYDNLKSGRVSNPGLESRLTARELSGRQMYVGEGLRPNTITSFATVNGLSLCTDVAQRSVIIYVGRAIHTQEWESETESFIREHRREIIGDLIAFLRLPKTKLLRSTRWGTWEGAVLSRCPEANEIQKVILDRQQSSDSESEEGALIADHIREKINNALDFGEFRRIFIASDLMAKWVSEVTGEKHTTNASSRLIKQKIDACELPQLIVNQDHKHGRGFLWCLGQKTLEGHIGHGSPQESDQIFWDIQDYIQRRRAEAVQQTAVNLAMKIEQEKLEVEQNRDKSLYG